MLPIAALTLAVQCAQHPSPSQLEKRLVATPPSPTQHEAPLLALAAARGTAPRTSVHKSFDANFLISLSARGARFLNEILCSRLCRLMVAIIAVGAAG